jgi:VCBS repeat-containing protein
VPANSLTPIDATATLVTLTGGADNNSFATETGPNTIRLANGAIVYVNDSGFNDASGQLRIRNADGTISQITLDEFTAEDSPPLNEDSPLKIEPYGDNGFIVVRCLDGNLVIELFQENNGVYQTNSDNRWVIDLSSKQVGTEINRLIFGLEGQDFDLVTNANGSVTIVVNTDSSTIDGETGEYNPGEILIDLYRLPPPSSTGIAGQPVYLNSIQSNAFIENSPLIYDPTFFPGDIIALGNGDTLYLFDPSSYSALGTIFTRNADGLHNDIELEALFYTDTSGIVTFDILDTPLEIQPYGENGFVVARSVAGQLVVEIYEQNDGTYTRIANGLTVINLETRESGIDLVGDGVISTSGNEVVLTVNEDGSVTIEVETYSFDESLGVINREVDTFALPVSNSLSEPETPIFVNTATGSSLSDPNDGNRLNNDGNLIRQFHFDTVADTAGNTFVIWGENLRFGIDVGSIDGTYFFSGPYTIFIQKFGPNGLPLSQPTAIDIITNTDNFINSLSATVLDNGNIALAWAESPPADLVDTPDGSFGTFRTGPPLIVTAIIDDVTLTQMGTSIVSNVSMGDFSESLISNFLAAQDPTPEIAATYGGGFIVSWETLTDVSLVDGDEQATVNINARLFDANGMPISDETIIGTSQSDAFFGSEMTVYDDGRILFTWANGEAIVGDGGFEGFDGETYQRLFQGPFGTDDIIFTGGTVAENSANGTAVAAATAVSTSAEAFTYSLTNNANGRFAINATTGAITVAPGAALNFEAATMHDIIVRITSATGRTYDETFTVNVSDINERPVVVTTPASVAFDEDTGAISFTIAANLFADPDAGDSFSVSAPGLPSWLTYNAATRTFSGTTPPDFNGVISLTVTATDAAGLTTSTTVRLTINPVNDAPVLLDSTASGNEDTAITGAVVATDIDSTALTYVLDRGPTNGSVIVNANGSYSYTPNANFTGTDSFSVRVSDGLPESQLSDTTLASVVVTVNPANDAPTDISVSNTSVNEVSSIGTVVGTATATDPDAGDTRTFSLVNNAGGRFAINPTTGQITVASQATNALNFEAARSHNIIIRVTDSTGLFYDETVTINVNDINESPSRLFFSSPFGGIPVIENAANGTPIVTLGAEDPDAGAVLTFSLVNDAGGRFTINPTTGQITVANGALLDFDTQEFHVVRARVQDQFGLGLEINVNIVVINGAEPPVLENSSISGDEDTAIAGTLVATDFDSLTLTYAVLTGPANGTVTVNPNGSYSYTPNANFNGTDSFTVRASDGALFSAPATVTVTVNAVNDAVTLANAIADQSSAEDAAFSYTLPANSFADVDNASLTLTAALANGDALPGWLSFNAATRTFSGQPPANFNGAIDVRVTASDGATSANDVFQINITPVNDAPVLANSTASGNEDAAITSTVAATDVDSTALTYAIGTGPANGTVTVNANGTYTYTPNANYNGTDSFTVVASDGSLNSTPATVAVTVNAVNDAPIVATLLADRSSAEDTAVNFTIPANSFSDVDNAALTLTTSTLHNWLTFNATSRSFTGTPPANFNGSFNITVTASDGTASVSDTFTLTITPVNDAPVLANSTASGNEDTAITGTVVATDVDSAALTYSVGTGPANGTVTVNANGTYNYTPNANYNGTDSFTVIASDGSLSSTAATVNITVNAVNDAVTLANALVDQTSAEDTAISFTLPANSFADVDGTTPTLTATLANGDPLPSWLSFNAATRTFAGQPPANFNGQIDVRVTASDGLTSANDVFQITITPVNDAAVAANASATGNEDGTITGTVTATDVDSTALTYALGTGPANGTLVFNANGSYVYTPNANFNGTDSFTFTASDGALSSTAATVTLTVAAVNDAPVATNGTASGNEDTVITGTLAATDVDGNALTYTLVTAPTNGTVTINANGSYSYTPNANYNGTDTFTFRASDGSLTSTGTVALTIAAVNDAPGSLTLASGGSVAENAANGTAVAQLAATDPDTGATLTYSLVNNAGGRFAINSTTGAITVANGALLDFETATSHAVTARVTDQGGLTRDLNITIGVTDVAEGNTPITGSNGNNTLNGTAGNDVINALGGNDTVNAGAGNDSVDGGSGRDILNGQDGDDQLTGGTGNDQLNGGSGNDRLDGGDDDDNLDGGSGNDQLIGGAGSDFLEGGSGNDTLDGGSDRDYLFAGAGDDVLFGGAGVDYLLGGAGQDTFRFTSIGDSPRASGFLSFLGRDTILDFNANNGPNHDIIDLSGIDANTNVAGDQAFTFIGNGAFTRVAGQLRYANNILSGDVNGDGIADFEIQIFFENPPSGPNPLDPTDFLL